MKNITGIAIAAALAAAAWSASSADLSDQERTELRQRAEEYHNERARNPEFQPGAGRLNPEPAEHASRRSKHVQKTHATSDKKEGMRAKAARKVRSLKNVPGAIVHGR